MKSFIEDRGKLIKNKQSIWNKVKLYKVGNGTNGSLLVLHVPDLRILAGFYGYLIRKLSKENKKVVLRGERRFHPTTIPRLFRDCEDDPPEKLNEMFNDLVPEIHKIFKKNWRFKRENVGPLLQHYGIATFWLDLVDNIFTASWFALFNSTSTNGYIKFFAYSTDNKDDLKISDLREEHSSLSLRPHCQHALSAKIENSKNRNPTNLHPMDFSEYMVAIAEIPNKENINIIKIQKSYMFPNPELDNTLKLLKNHEEEVLKKIKNILRNHKCKCDSLGKIK